MKYFCNQQIWYIGNRYVCKVIWEYIDPCLECDFFGIDKKAKMTTCSAHKSISKDNCYEKYFKQIIYV